VGVGADWPTGWEGQCLGRSAIKSGRRKERPPFVQGQGPTRRSIMLVFSVSRPDHEDLQLDGRAPPSPISSRRHPLAHIFSSAGSPLVEAACLYPAACHTAQPGRGPALAHRMIGRLQAFGHRLVRLGSTWRHLMLHKHYVHRSRRLLASQISLLSHSRLEILLRRRLRKYVQAATSCTSARLTGTRSPSRPSPPSVTPELI
jgi:hypothetical protein